MQFFLIFTHGKKEKKTKRNEKNREIIMQQYELELCHVYCMLMAAKHPLTMDTHILQWIEDNCKN